MNERDLKLTRKEIKRFDSLIQWQVIDFVPTTLYGSLFIHLPSATFNHSIREKYFRYAICVEAVKITCVFFLYLNTFCTCLTYIQRILIARYSTALSTFQYNIARFLIFCFVKTKQFFVPLVLCYEKESLVGMALPMQIRKYIQCSKLSIWLMC